MHPMQASSRWDPTRGDLLSRLHARATDFHLENRVRYRFFNFDLPEGSQGNTEADWGHWGQTRFGHARSERRRPQFTAHKSVHPFQNGLRSVGSSATRPVPTIVAASVRVVHIAPVSRGLHGQMRRVGTTCKPQRRPSLGKNMQQICHGRRAAQRLTRLTNRFQTAFPK